MSARIIAGDFSARLSSLSQSSFFFHMAGCHTLRRPSFRLCRPSFPCSLDHLWKLPLRGFARFCTETLPVRVQQHLIHTHPTVSSRDTRPFTVHGSSSKATNIREDEKVGVNAHGGSPKAAKRRTDVKARGEPIELNSPGDVVVNPPPPKSPKKSKKRRKEQIRAKGALGGQNALARVCENFLDAVGYTPLIYLRHASAASRCEIYGKCEFNNPGGSVKDRPAKYIIEQAEQKGTLSPSHPWIVEGSAGNTAIGLALASKEKGYRVVCVMPDNQTQDKKDMLKVCGALVVEVPFQKVWHPDHFVVFSGRLANVLNASWGAQFDNLANKLSHVETTGPEIWEQMDGRIDGFVSAVGTGGTIAGVSEYLRSKSSKIQIALADIPGSALYRYFTEGQLRAEGSSIVENIGQGRITGQLQDFQPDVAFEIPDEESLGWTHSLLEHEGLAVGMSSGVNLAAAVRLAARLGPGHRICTVLCDLGTRYAKKQWNITYLKENNLPYPTLLGEEGDAVGVIGEAVHASYAPREEVARAEEEHAGDASDPYSKI